MDGKYAKCTKCGHTCEKYGDFIKEVAEGKWTPQSGDGFVIYLHTCNGK